MNSLRYVDRRLVAFAVLALLVEGYFLLSDVHLLWKPLRTPSGAVLVAKAGKVFHQVKVRSPLQLNWFDLTPGQDLYEGDEVATVGDATASLQFIDGQSVSLDPNSFLVLRSSGSAGSQTFQLALLQGGLQQMSSTAKDGKQPSGRLEVQVGGRTVVAQGPSSFRIDSRNDGRPQIAVEGGNVSVTEVSSHNIEIDRGHGPLSLQPFGSVMPDFKPPVLKSPSSDAVLINPANVWVTWKTVDGANSPVLLEISRDVGFTQLVLSKIVVGENRAEFVPDHKGHYFWRVSRLAGERRLASNIAGFEIRRALKAPLLARPRVEKGLQSGHQPVDAPVLNRPIIHYQKERFLRNFRPSWRLKLVQLLDQLLFETASADDPGVEPESRYSVELDWDRVAEATAYVLQISADEGFQHVITEKVLTQASFKWHTDTAGFYYWRVAGVDKEGDRGPFSEFNTFSIKVERNRQGDESSYDTYLRFDEYAKYGNRLRFSWGPSFEHYYFSSSDLNSPSSVIFKKQSLLNGQADYDYRLNPYYSMQFSFRVEKSPLDESNYEDRPNQPYQPQYETILGAGISRRFFQPRHYLSLQTGVRVSFIDVPVLDRNSRDSNSVVYDAYGFIGVYGSGTYHQLLGKSFDAAANFGLQYQYSGGAYRAAQYSSIELRRQINDWIHIGLRGEEILVTYRFNSSSLIGNAHSLTFRPVLFLDWSF